jgi:glycosyltransferase involved in cell wall biosynthesis
MFSIIIPLFNKSPYISKSVQSVLDQTFQEFELIIVNDGSTDNSLEIAMQFTDSRIRIIDQPNAGVSAARNNGVKASKYDYIAFLDADDWWHPDFLKEIKQCIEKFPEAGIYGSNYQIVKNGTAKPSNVGINQNYTSGYIDYFQTYTNNFSVPINCSFVVIKKQTFADCHGFNINLKFSEDFDLWVRIALNNKVAYVNRVLAFSNQDADPAQRALGKLRIWKPEEHFIFNAEYLKNEETKNPELKKLLDGLRVRSLLHYHLRKLHISETRKILDNIDWEKQTPYYRRIYKYPRLLVKTYFIFRHLGSSFKQKLTHIKRQILK